MARRPDARRRLDARARKSSRKCSTRSPTAPARRAFAAWESHKGQLSVVYALDDKWSLQVGGFATLYRRNINSEYGALVAVWRRF